MKEVLSFGTNKVVRIKNEKVSGILLDITALQSDGTTVCDIADLNAANLQIVLKRQGAVSPLVIANDYLDYVLRAIGSGNLRYTVATTKRDKGYFLTIPFDGGISLQGDDVIEVTFKCPTSTFSSLSVANSEIIVESVPAKNTTAFITCIKPVNYGNGDDEIDHVFDNGTIKIVLLNDLTADYGASTKAKPINGIDLIAQGLQKRVSENVLIAENLDMLQYNPETNVMNLVVYHNQMQPLVSARLTCKFDKAVDTDAKIMTLVKTLV